MACGEMCLYSVLKKKGWDNPHFTGNNAWVQNGVTPENLAQTFRNLGYRSSRWKPKTLQELNDWSRQGTSFIMMLSNGTGGAHFVVFEGMHNGVVYYMDPSFGDHRQTSVEDVRNRWIELVWVQ